MENQNSHLLPLYRRVITIIPQLRVQSDDVCVRLVRKLDNLYIDSKTQYLSWQTLPVQQLDEALHREKDGLLQIITDLENLRNVVRDVYDTDYLIVPFLPPPMRSDFFFFTHVVNIIFILTSVRLDGIVLCPFFVFPRPAHCISKDKIHLTVLGSRQLVIAHRVLQKIVYDLYLGSPQLLSCQDFTIRLMNTFTPNQPPEAYNSPFGTRDGLDEDFELRHYGVRIPHQKLLAVYPTSRRDCPFSFICADSRYRHLVSRTYKETIYSTQPCRYQSLLACQPGGTFYHIRQVLHNDARFTCYSTNKVPVVYANFGFNYVWKFVERTVRQTYNRIPSTQFYH